MSTGKYDMKVGKHLMGHLTIKTIKEDEGNLIIDFEKEIESRGVLKAKLIIGSRNGKAFLDIQNFLVRNEIWSSS